MPTTKSGRNKKCYLETDAAIDIRNEQEVRINRVVY